MKCQQPNPYQLIIGFLLIASCCWLLANTSVPVKAAGPALSEKTLKALQQDPANALRMERRVLKQGIAYYAVIPAGYTILPMVSDQLQPIERFSEQVKQSPLKSSEASSETPNPLVVINAGYFDPQNHKTISYITQNGKLAADPTLNERLSQNPSLKPYLPKIFNRSEFRVYNCKSPTTQATTRYDIVPHNTPAPANCSLTHALGAGPQLLPTERSLEEAVVDYDASGKMIRDPFGIKTPNARSAVGITANGGVIILMGAQDPSRKTYGFNFEQLRSLLSSLGATKAIALDGGSSSAIMLKGVSEEETGNTATNMDTMGKTDISVTQQRLAMPVIYGKFNKEGQPVKRPIKSVLMVLSPASQK